MVFQISNKANGTSKSPRAIKRTAFKLTLISATVLTTIFLFALCIDTSFFGEDGRKVYSLSPLEVDVKSAKPVKKSIFGYLGPVARLFPWTANPKPRILVWNSFFSQADYIPRPGVIGCPVDCEVTTNRSLLDRSDAVVLHWRNIDLEDLPAKEGKRRWVIFNLEAPPHTPIHVLKAIEDSIRWTATYRRDSDIFTPYGRVIPRTNRHRKREILKKPSLICWIVSNCDSPSRRKSYVHQLEKYVPIEVYGRCGNLSCPSTEAENCYQTVSRRCKFYLSFENSLCRDYVTEKLFYVLKTDMVPIVMGGADYAQILPNHSYIDALDYDDPKDLATYLLELDKDPDRFIEYHSWKSYYAVENEPMRALSCGLCKILHREDAGNQRDLLEWWFDNATCFSWVQYFNTHLVM